MKKEILDEIKKISNPFALLAFLFRFCFKEMLVFILIGTFVAMILMTKMICEKQGNKIHIKIDKHVGMPGMK
jgi:hypothetical protein